MKDVTPKSMRCDIGVDVGCPAIIEVTPEDMACVAAECPALYEQEEGHIIIGKVMKEIPKEIFARIGEGEFAIWVPRGMVQPGPGKAPNLPKPVKVA